jgi:hypothetical protein
LKKLKKRVIDRYGMPKKILTDGGPSFRKELEQYAEENKIKLKTSNAYKHDTNGMAERIIRTVEEKLWLYTNSSLNNWDEYLSEIQASLNSHEAWGPKASPFFLNHGFERNTGTQNQLMREASNLVASEEYTNYGLEREAENDIIMEEATQENEKTQERMKGQRKGSAWLPEVESLVMVSWPPETISSKLESLSDGPFRVIRVDKHGNCTLGPVSGNAHELQTVSSNRLSRYRGKGEVENPFLPSDTINLEPFKAVKDKKVQRTIKAIKEHFEVDEYISPTAMIGTKVEIFWNQPGAKGWWSGTITGYNPVNGTFWVKYDLVSADGEDTYPERLISTTMPKWNILSEKK